MPDSVTKPHPLHAHAPEYLRSIVHRHHREARNDLSIAQAEFRGAIGMLLCVIPKDHEKLRDAVLHNAVSLYMDKDESVAKVLEHIEHERERVRLEQAAKS